MTLARNRYFRAPSGLVLDVGAWAEALEYASGRPATLVGKPSPEFYRTALRLAGAAASQTVVVGDDLETERAVARMARERGVSRSTVIRDAIVAAADRRKRSEAARPRPYAAIAHLIGVARGGPPELSTATGRRFRELLASRGRSRR